MIYDQQEPGNKLSGIIKKFWMIDSANDGTIRRQKIIPDGYPEIIFHYKDPYKINIHGQWELQDKYLLAGQIRNFFYLENTARAGIFAITFQPWIMKTLFDLNMYQLVDKVLPINKKLMETLKPVKSIAVSSLSFNEKVSSIERWFLKYTELRQMEISKGESAVKLILRENGKISIQEILRKINISEKSLERMFKTHIGLSAKFYSRIIRLSHVFRLISGDKTNWSDLAFLAGFYDQSHFIKNFKEFTGDEPSRYGFNEKNMANFFLK